MKLLAIIDTQNDFIDGVLGTKEAEAIVPRVCERIRQADKNTIIIFTRDTHSTNYLNTFEGERLPVEHCIYKTDGWMIHPDILEAARESGVKYHICNKFTFGMNMDEWYEAIDDLSDWPRNGQYVEEIEIMGLCTDICVISNTMILRAMFPNYPIAVNSQCCAGVTPESHERALEAMKMCQIDII